MLPGFRFLFAAILLSTSILVFGLGAAALLRATHQQYVNNPGWRNGPQEQMFAQAPEPAQPVLAVLRTEPEPPAETTPSLRDQVPTIALPLSEPEQVAALTTETDVQPEAAAPLAEVPAIEAAKPEPTVTAAAPASIDTLTPADTTAAMPEAEPAASEPAPADPALAAAALDVASARLAALNAATAATDAPAKARTENSKAESTKSDSKATKRKAKAKKRARVVRRPPPQQLQQQLDPFGQQQPAFATTTTARTR
ncbi:hypothetical protein AOQ72_14295 [Bradyrhizobium yuanmingense]|uniref:Uncharacterized protein n=1 Tax=Bradyrhizobium yuanmingense TaxID=108015 RepID=A0A0R3CPF3_9BRAD|nr:hypothetical protein [Bradyrhizobium yuanmingense]KRP99653.1 hypothetical protein AOQ72_14295 [Bradyrhizobium yuanmingense]